MRVKFKAPKFSSYGFTPPCEDGFVLWRENCDIYFVKYDCTIIITNWPKAHICVLEGFYDEDIGGG